MKYKATRVQNLADYQVKNIATRARNRLIQIIGLCTHKNDNDLPQHDVIKTINKQRQRAMSGGGSIHAGSLRAAKILKDVSNAALEPFLINKLVAILASRQHL